MEKNNYLNDLIQLVNVAGSNLKTITKIIGEKPVSRKLRDEISHFKNGQTHFIKAIESRKIEEAFSFADIVSVFGTSISNTIKNMPDIAEEIRSTANHLSEISSEIKNNLENNPLTFSPIDTAPSLKEFYETGESIDLEVIIQNLKSQIKDIAGRAMQMENRAKELDDLLLNIDTKSKNVSSAYEKNLEDISLKSEQINKLLGHASGRIIAGDYEKSAAAEMSAANNLRSASLTCMAAIAIILGYSFWESAVDELNWQVSLFRVGLAFLLSAPAAYLARESTKHRAQQYYHLQMALDLKAVTPYLASLPDEIQHKIKTDIASKLFAGRDLSQTISDSYPINTHEIIMELIKKLELPKTYSK